ncbi:MAG: flagellar hook-basal body complex protein FliE [Spirochaetia bacterium]|nr:flagellar hook-basal body complex protein FliE [Spirochaetia bacterium]
MDIISKSLTQSMVKGDIIPLKTSDLKHYNGIKSAKTSESPAENFAKVLTRALQQVNDQQVYAENLSHQAVADPGSVSVHSVLIAAEKARMSLTYTKTLADMAVKTYRELVNLR